MADASDAPTTEPSTLSAPPIGLAPRTAPQSPADSAKPDDSAADEPAAQAAGHRPADGPAADHDAASTILPPAQSVAATAQDLADRAISFLSTAPPEQLFAISVGGVIVLYLVFGRLSLLVVGVVAGAVGHASLSLTHSKKAHPQFGESLSSWIESRQRDGASDGDIAALMLKVRPFPPRLTRLTPPAVVAQQEGRLLGAPARDGKGV